MQQELLVGCLEVLEVATPIPLLNGNYSQPLKPHKKIAISQLFLDSNPCSSRLSSRIPHKYHPFLISINLREMEMEMETGEMHFITIPQQ